ncbi:MAG: hypothetical protein U5R31_11245 [Acidimicrobiia bacterium]|nr:hypothetical protein [Acidimicrobiia bacterium]
MDRLSDGDGDPVDGTRCPRPVPGHRAVGLSLVDPDNRRPVDFDHRRRLLAEVEDLDPAAAWRRVGEGLPKLLLVRRGLDLRRRRPECFGSEATYSRVRSRATDADRVLAYRRAGAMVTIVPLGARGTGGSRREGHAPRGPLAGASAPRARRLAMRALDARAEVRSGSPISSGASRRPPRARLTVLWTFGRDPERQRSKVRMAGAATGER